MKILIDAHLSENKITGIGRYLNGLIEALITTYKDDEFIILVSKNNYQDHPLNKIQSNNVKRIEVGLKGPSLKQHFQIPRIISKVKPDVYHHPHFDLPIGVKTPAVATIHDLKYIQQPRFFPEKGIIKSTYMKHMVACSLKRANKIIAVSQFTKNDLIEIFKVSPDNIQVIHHGLSMKDFQLKFGDTSAILLKYNIEKPYLLFVSERRPHKNLENLIRAFKKVCNLYQKPLYLLIVGKPYGDYSKPQDIVKDEQMSNRVIFTDYITDDDLIVLYKNADCFIIPSFYEGFGLPILEAMAFGVPVLGSNRTSIPEIIDNPELVFNPESINDIADKILHLINDLKFQKRAERHSFERAKQFTWEKAAKQTMDLYRSVYFG